ncbi:fumarylacetoacetate hydrolase family protein [Sphingomonas sp.]|uniref:fumarylacetoacetate hydrolase family protein n=1 Tax=Sphingomonas sp. TaxID=28214 RepID=UPI000DB7AF1E|nr:fumarylacetoacetate hydrolase family protein [Sphingomonas sp.]PZU06528.1 MAG: 5-carboxymethyl-2-hydroxymuconate isomerase [Sphingomonas sp.]
MRYVTVDHDGRERVGTLEDDTVLLLPEENGDLVDVIARGTPLPGERQAVALSACRLLAPIRRFRRDLLCVGLNYHAHFEEGRERRPEGFEMPTAPTFFTKGPDSVVGPEAGIPHDPRLSQKWDYEAEIALVIGRAGRSIPRNRAWDHVFGFTLANDVSARDLQRRHGGQWFKGKSLDGSCPLGPFVATRDEVDLATMRLTCDVNGERRQSAPAAAMVFDVADIIAEASFGMTLRPGDVILTGTPAGIGNAMKPPRYLAPGDIIEIAADGLGTLRSSVFAADLVGDSDVHPF